MRFCGAQASGPGGPGRIVRRQKRAARERLIALALKGGGQMIDAREELLLQPPQLGSRSLAASHLHIVGRAAKPAATCPLGFSALDRRPRRTPRGPTRTPLHPLPSPQGRRPHEPSMQRNERRVAWAEGKVSRMGVAEGEGQEITVGGGQECAFSCFSLRLSVGRRSPKMRKITLSRV